MRAADCRHGAGDGVRAQRQGQVRCPFSGWRFFFWCPSFLRLPGMTFSSAPVSSPSPRFGGDHQCQRFCGFFLRFLRFLRVLVVLLPRFKSGKGHGGGGEFPHEGAHLRGGDAFGVDDAEGRHVGTVSSQITRVGGDGVFAASSFHAQVDEVLVNGFLERGLRLLMGRTRSRTKGRRTQHGGTGRRGHTKQTRAAGRLAHRAFCLLHAISSAGSV